jgi:hypothetical protein
LREKVARPKAETDEGTFGPELPQEEKVAAAG